MAPRISLSAKQELTSIIREKYQQSTWKEKRKILDGFIAATGYQRKYAINLLHSTGKRKSTTRRGRIPLYNEAVRQGLITAWTVTNQICAKRLVPFLPELVSVLERYGHLFLFSEV